MSAPEAGNTTETLKPVDVNTAAAAINAPVEVPVEAVPVEVTQANVEVAPIETPATEDVDKEAEISAAATKAVEADPSLKAQIEAEAENIVVEVETVSKEAFATLRNEFDALVARVESFNARSGHRI